MSGNVLGQKQEAASHIASPLRQQTVEGRGADAQLLPSLFPFYLVGTPPYGVLPSTFRAGLLSELKLFADSFTDVLRGMSPR